MQMFGAKKWGKEGEKREKDAKKCTIGRFWSGKSCGLGYKTTKTTFFTQKNVQTLAHVRKLYYLCTTNELREFSQRKISQ